MLLHGVANYIEIIWSLLKENNQLPYSYRITNDKFRSWKRAKMQKNGCAERDHNIAKGNVHVGWAYKPHIQKSSHSSKPNAWILVHMRGNWIKQGITSVLCISHLK